MTSRTGGTFGKKFGEAVRLADINVQMIHYLIKQLNKSAHNIGRLRECLYSDRHKLVFDNLERNFVDSRLGRIMSLMITYHQQLNTLGVTCSSRDMDVEAIDIGYYISDSDEEESSQSAFEEALRSTGYQSENEGVVQASNTAEIR